MCKRNSEAELRIARRMKAAGVPLALDGLEELEEPVKLIQNEGPGCHLISSSYIRGIRTMMGLRIESHITIVGNSSVPFELCGLEVLLPWKKEPAYLLPDPADYFAPQTYKFPNEKTGGYDRSDVIARSNVILRRGQTISGFLLGYDCQPIPDGFSDGSRLPITLNIINQLGESHQRELILPINRSQEWGPQPVPRPRRDLFAKRDEPKTRAEKVPAEKVPAEKEYAAR